jgi:hypothetical protein
VQLALRSRKPLIAELDRDGHDTTHAWAILATMRLTQALHLEDRRRILAKLAAPKPCSVSGEVHHGD